MSLDWKNYTAKYFTNLVSVITLLGGVWFAYDYYLDREEDAKQRLLLEDRYRKLLDSAEDSKVLGLAAQLATAYKEQAELAKQTTEAWKELAKEREERIKLFSSSTISVDSAVQKQKGPDYQFRTPNGTDGYTLNELRIEGEDSPPIGYIMIKDDGEVYKKNYKFEIKVESVQFKDDLTGKVRVVSRAFLVPLENGLAEKRRPDFKKWEGEKYPLPVSGGEVLVDPVDPIIPQIKTKGLVYWPTNINAGFGVFSDDKGHTGSKLYADLTLLGWGVSKRDLDWKFANVGLNYGDIKGIGFHIIPASTRLLPGVFNNTYIGPGYHTDSNSQGFLLGLSTGL